jgi:large subunit ribosomal protein L25
MSELTIEVNRREDTGKNANRRLRAQDQIPAVVYGGGLDPLAISVSRRKMDEVYKKAGNENVVFQLQLAGTDKSRHAMVRDTHHDAVTGKILHLDFQRVMLDQKVRVVVHIQLHGEAERTKHQGGLLDFVTREIHIEALPNSIPGHLDLDVSKLAVGHHLEAGDIPLPEGVTLSDDANRVIVSVGASKLHDEDAAAGGAEPEVAAKGKKPND